MPQVIQSKCPKCQNVLRIPADWLGKSMRCKHCREVFQAQAKAALAPAIRPGVPLSVPLSAPAAAPPVPAPSRAQPIGDPFGFHDEPGCDGPLLRTRSRKKGGGWKIGIILVGCVLAVGAGLFVIAGPQLKNLFKNSGDPDKFANNAKNDGETPDGDPSEPPDKDSGTKKIGNKGPFTKGPKKGGAKVAGRPFPRRALLINVNNYLYANPLYYGYPRVDRYPGSSTAVLADQMTRRPLNIPATQVSELSDGSKNPQPTLKPVIENAIADFLDTSREQDRIILLFTGHAVDIDKEAYLVPLEGDMKDAKTLIPLQWVYDRLGKCLAWQKLLVLDVCRYPPARGLELPGSGEMGEVLDAKIKSPPRGVQVWASCSKGQQAYEFERGSAFLQSLCHSMQEGLSGIQEPANALPLDSLSARVNQKLKELLVAEKLDQTPQLTGKDASGSGPYDPAEPVPAQLAIRRPAAPKGQFAGEALVRNILDEINKIPPVRQARPGADNLLHVAYLPPFPAAALEPFKEKYSSFNELKKMVEANPMEYPLRAAVLDAVGALRDNAQFVMEESLTNPGGPITAQIKSGFLAKQQEPGKAILYLEQAIAKLQAAALERDKESSKRWQANYEYTKARLLSRLVYTFEYNFILADVRSDRLPELNSAIHNGWRVGAQKEVQCAKKEAKVKGWLKDIKKSWTRILKDYPDTPWAVMARRESATALGLEWRPSRD